MVRSVLVRDATLVLVGDEPDSLIPDCSILIRDGVIVGIGPRDTLPGEVDQVVDASGMLLLPGLVNAHHHLFQTLTRTVPEAIHLPLEPWHRAHYRYWSVLDAAAVRAAARMALVELLLSGCTTVLDHFTSFPGDVSAGDVIDSAADVGIRLVLGVGGRVSGTRHTGGQAPEGLADEPADLLFRTASVIERHHDPDEAAMVQVAVAPSHPLSLPESVAVELGTLARRHGVGMHTHLAETVAEVERFRSTTGCSPVEYVSRVGWLEGHASFAHGVHLTQADLDVLGRAGAAVVYCPASNMRLGSGVLDIAKCREAGVEVGLGTDGAASNDASNMLLDVRLGMLLQRVIQGAEAMGPHAAVRLATSGSSAALARPSLGRLAVGAAGDVIGFSLDRPEFASVGSNYLERLPMSNVGRVDLSVIAGKVRISGGEPVDLDVTAVVAEFVTQCRRLERRIRPQGTTSLREGVEYRIQ